MSITLRPYQDEQGVSLIRDSFRRGKRAPLYVLPCGGGKSIILSYVALHTARRGRRVTIQAHRIELVKQLSESLDKVGCPHGFIAAGYKETISEAVQLASVDTLAKRAAKNPERYRADLIVTDEGHHLIQENKWGRIIARYPEARLLIVTASPLRLSGEGLGVHAHGYADDLIIGPSVKDLIAAKALVPIKVYAPPLADLSGVKIHHGEYDAAQSAAILDKAVITGSAIAHYKRLCAGKRAMVFAVNVQHSRHVAEQFNAAGIPARHVDADTPAAEREQAMCDYKAGRILVLVNVALYTEGIDCPGVVAVIMLRRTKSLTMFMQMVGRGSRPAEGKEYGILLDHVNNVELHGLPDFEGIEWTLDGVKRGSWKSDDDRVQRMKTCTRCYAVNPIWRPTCEQCNHVFEPQREMPKETAGELVEITDAQKELMRKRAKVEVSAARTQEQLEAIAKERGYAAGWVKYIMAARAKNKYRGPVLGDQMIKHWKGEMA